MAGRKVLFGVDGSDHSIDAFHFFMNNFWKEGDYLYLVHCPQRYNFVDASPAVIEELLEKIKKEVNELQEKYKELMSKYPHAKGQFAPFHGSPGEEIVKSAANEKCDLIVMGCRGLGKLRRTFLGSVSDYVLHHAHCPVLVCRK